MENNVNNESTSSKTSVAAIIGLVFAIIALLLSAVPIINNFAAILALIGFVCGIIGLVASRKPNKSGKGLSIASIVLSVIALAIVLVSQSIYSKAIDDAGKQLDDSAQRMSGEKTNEILGKEVDVTLGQFSATTDEFGIAKTELPVKVTNKLGEKKTYSIQIEVVDASGSRIADDYINANDLGPNQSQDFQAFQFVDSAKLDAIKAGKFKIVKVSQI